MVFVRDTAKVAETLPGYVCYPHASVDLDVRLALYERAKMNFFVPNGPYGLAIFTDVPHMVPMMMDPTETYWPYTPLFWEKNMGIGEGDQWPWSGPHQRIIWGARDDCDVLIRAWEQTERVAA